MITTLKDNYLLATNCLFVYQIAPLSFSHFPVPTLVFIMTNATVKMNKNSQLNLAINPTPRIALFVGWLVTKFQPHHTHMKHSQGLNITDVCTMHICIIHTCIMYKYIIMDTCITLWIHESCIHASWIHAPWIHVSWIHASWTHLICMGHTA